MMKTGLLGSMLALLLAGITRAEALTASVAVACDPPLTRPAADAYLGTILFMFGAVEGIDPGTPPLEIQDQFVRELADAYCDGTEAERVYVATAPDRLIMMRTLWPELGEAHRAELRAIWRAQLGLPSVTPQEPERAAVDSALDVQRRAAWVSEMLRINHETQMTIIDNLRVSSCPYWRVDCR